MICDPNFKTPSVRYVSAKTKFDVTEEYGLERRSYWPAIEIDHIVSLELGGSNEIANLYPEKADAHPGYHVKDKLETKVARDWVCEGKMSLRTAQRRIASDWESLYKTVYGVAPTG